MDWVQTAAIVGALVVAIAALSVSRSEAALRIRPWVNITGVRYGPAPDGSEGRVTAAITVCYDNIGALPARFLTFELGFPLVVARVSGARATVTTTADHRFVGATVGVVFPREASEAEFTMDAGLRDRLMTSLGKGQTVQFSGIVTYFGTNNNKWLGLGGDPTTWHTRFTAIMRPGEVADYRAGKDVLLRWANESADGW